MNLMNTSKHIVKTKNRKSISSIWTSSPIKKIDTFLLPSIYIILYMVVSVRGDDHVFLLYILKRFLMLYYRRYKCTFAGCDYRASYAKHIKVHLRKHLGEKVILLLFVSLDIMIELIITSLSLSLSPSCVLMLVARTQPRELTTYRCTKGRILR